MSMHRSQRPGAADSASAHDSARIVCLICKALYIPAPSHTYLLQAPQPVLESAFMSMCHFCFRCRRPACPGCWDDIHGVCGDCAVETHLPFRSTLSPLQGALFVSARRTQVARVLPLTTPLICVRPGRFQRAPLPIDTASTVYLHTLSLGQLSSQPSSSSSTIFGDDESEPDITELATRPEMGLTLDTDADETDREPPTLPEPRPRPVSWPVRILTALLWGSCLALSILIIAALISPEANTLIFETVRIDVRAELAVLWRLIRSIHF